MAPRGTRYPSPARASARAHGRTLGILDRPGRHVHRYRRPAPGRAAGGPQGAVGEPGRLPRRRGGRHQAAPRRRTGPGNPRRGDRLGQARHHGGHQRPARAQGRAHGPGHHPGFRRRAAHRLPEPAADIRPPHPAPRGALPAGHRGRRAGQRGRRGPHAARRGRRQAQPPAGPRGWLQGRRRGLHARLPVPGTRKTHRRHRSRRRLHPGVGVAPDQPADEAGLPRRHHGGGRLPVAHPAAVRDRGGRRTAGRKAAVHAVQRRPDRRGRLPRQGLHPVRPGRRHRRHGQDRGRGRLRQGHRLRHGRHLHRRVPFRRGTRARVRDAGRRGADAGADAVHPHRGRGRRLGAALRRQPVPGRARLGRGRPRAGLLPARRPAHRHRRQRPARPDPAGLFPERLRCERRPAPGRGYYESEIYGTQ